MKVHLHAAKQTAEPPTPMVVALTLFDLVDKACSLPYHHFARYSPLSSMDLHNFISFPYYVA